MLRGGKAAGLFVGGLLVAGAAMLGGSGSAEARPQYFLKGFVETYPDLKKETGVQKCNVCHYGTKKTDRNNYGQAFGKTLSELIEKNGGSEKERTNVKDLEKVKEALKKAEEEKSAVKDKTFGELIKDKKLPATGWEPPKKDLAKK